MKLGISPAKAQRRKGDGPMPVIQRKREGSEKISPSDRIDTDSELSAFAPLRE